MTLDTNENDSLNESVQSGGSFEIIKNRLENQGKDLKNTLEKLNEHRISEFGGSSNEIINKIKIRTENNCTPVDMAQVNGQLLVGFKTNIGLKNKVEVSDIFSLYNVIQDGENKAFEETSIKGTYLDDPKFISAFNDLMHYYKDNKLLQVTKKNDSLYIVFQIGQLHTDCRVFKWNINKSEVVYVTDRANDDLVNNSKNHCFEWIETTRSDFINGKNPHISILNKVFVETIGGDLTIKIENNTEDGLGIYSEDVVDPNQVLADAKVFFAEVGTLILLKIKPNNEDFRYFIFDTVNQSVVNCKSLAYSCQELPENHGIVFPDGYYLNNGDYKIFEKESEDLVFFNVFSSPNGEDYLYIYFDPIAASYVLYSYNLINKKIENPIHAHGYSLFDNGHLAVFRHSENQELSKINTLTIWKTPFFSDEYFLKLEKEKSKEKRDQFLLKIGNADLVSGLSDLFTIVSFINKKEISNALFENIIKLSTKAIDDYHWLKSEKVGEIDKKLSNIIETSELVVDEFEKVKIIKKQALEILEEIETEHNKLISEIKLTPSTDVAKLISLLSKINKHIGRIISVKSQRYINVEELEKMTEYVKEQKNDVNNRLLKLLTDKRSFNVYFTKLDKIEKDIVDIKKVVEIEPLIKEVNIINEDISSVNNEVNDVEVEDSTIVSNILDSISEVFSKINQVNAKLKNVKKNFLSAEAKIEFAAQFKLLSQSVSNALSNSNTPEKCDIELSKLILQIEKLESKFTDFDDYLTEIYTKRDEISNSFENHKQQLINANQKRILSLVKAGKINLNSISKKASKFETIDDLNTYFSSDLMVVKLHQLIKDITDLNGVVQAEDLDNELVKIKDLSIRSLRDNQDIFKNNGSIMIMGKHEFAVNKSPLDLTIINKDGKMQTHLTSTEYFNTVDIPELNELTYLWDIDIPSESKDVYRSEYLAYLIINDAINKNNNLTMDLLITKNEDNKLNEIITSYVSTRYKDNYVKGVHDHDANLILSNIVNIYKNAGILTYSQEIRAFGFLSNLYFNKPDVNKVVNARNLLNNLSNNELWNELINQRIQLFDSNSFFNNKDKKSIAEFSLINVINEKLEFSNEANELSDNFHSFTLKNNINFEFLKEMNVLEKFENVSLWMQSFAIKENIKLKDFFIDATILYLIKQKLLIEDNISYVVKNIQLNCHIEGLIGDHNKINNGSMDILLDKYLSDCSSHYNDFYPNFEKFNQLRKSLSEKEKDLLCLDDFKSKPLTSFVRNKLITDVYLPMIGDNFAKQIGTVGENKRSDLMGLLLLISPPGYGKTTLIEYVANKLGLVFVKVNCPSIGHSVTSLDPNEANDSTSKKEINKINLAFEMGSNVLLYLDDIQHTNPEFLQKFISLCDGTRRIEGVWNGQTKTYDMRNKKFAVVMAGNPYTESGETFKIPDMLANRADIYNLGDILGGKVDTFKLSYIENSLTSNTVLAPLATRNMEDLYKLVDMAKGENIALDTLEYNYSAAEANEIISVLKHMLQILNVVFSVNMEYIKSAASSDSFRTEPVFKLQGSYRNMNKMVEKLVSAMNKEEITQLIVDHYTGESQTLTSGAESNMLKLKSLMNVITDEEQNRWNEICKDFNRNRKMGGDDSDSGKMIANQLALFVELYSDKSKFNEKVINPNNIIENNITSTDLEHLIKEIKHNQSEEALITLFDKRMEELTNNFMNIITRKDEQFINTFAPMINYFEEVLKKHNSKK